LVDNPGRGFCLSFATELGIFRLENDAQLRNQKEDAIKAGSKSYRTRISLRGTPKDHCKKCVEAMKYVIDNADETELSARSCKVLEYWKVHPEVHIVKSKFVYKIYHCYDLFPENRY
jgi:hypothetical protein